MSTLVFIKSLVLRAIDQTLRRDVSLKEKLNEIYKQSVNTPLFTVEQFRNDLAETHPGAVNKIDTACKRIRPRFVYNMVEASQDSELFDRIDSTLDEVLSIECDHIGVIPYEQSVRKMLKEPGIFLRQAPKSSVAIGIEQLAKRIVRYWDVPIEGSATLLAKYLPGEAKSKAQV